MISVHFFGFLNINSSLYVVIQKLLKLYQKVAFGMSTSDSDVVLDEVTPKNQNQPQYSGAFAFLNQMNSNKTKKELDDIPSSQILPIDSLPLSTLKAIDPEQLCIFYQKDPKKSPLLFGPLSMDSEAESFYGDFEVSPDVISATKSGYKAILFCLLNDEPTWPVFFNGFINNHKVERPNLRFTPSSQYFWIDVTKFLVKHKNSIQITAKTEIPGQYIYVVRLFYAPTDFNCVVEISRRPHFNFSDWSRIYKQTIIDNDDVDTKSFILSLICPLGLIRISEPVRGNFCQHLLCFDLTVYLKYVRDCGKWNCPICDQECLFDSIRIDEFVLGILKSVPDNCESVEIEENGEYKPYKFSNSEYDYDDDD
ncbi:hypothetical protein TRFO_02840 [Tritrichomonas foetus]|uniref:SP-RING-type domain-containing protein n=1 Tax=Tritrichomonas foetus TaxID=1144522 RepID=A0A1J4KWB4_9EUKA|nr:hypothetical protein TRFO_02840 [Tritrichomonas foetus]|eukprot:OHT15519.1 hypothetical protein TRFO_02840 [Tritrichomonas foetus]